MDFSQFYNSISSFWESIAPIFYSHVLAFLAIIWILKPRLHIASRLKIALRSKSYKRWKTVFDEFELRNKLPYLAIVGTIIYFALFNNIILTTLDDLSITNVSYNQTDFWRENKPLDDLVEIGSFSSNPKIHIWELENLKSTFLEGYKAKYLDYYNSNINWLVEKSGKWLRYYQCAITFFLFLIIFTIVIIRKKTYRSYKVLLRILILFILTSLWIAYTRYQYELYVEKSLKAEIRFVTVRLTFDEEAKKNRLNEEQTNQLKYNLFSELKRTEIFSDNFWLLRVLEKFGVNQREFKTLTDEEFQQRYGYLSQYAPKTENFNSDATN